MNKKLKPCPFCGGEAAMTVSCGIGGEPKHFTPTCTKDYCPGQSRKQFDSEKYAVLFWNNRAPDHIYCGECRHLRDGRDLHMGAKYKYCNIYITEKNENDFCSFGERIEENEQIIFGCKCNN